MTRFIKSKTFAWLAFILVVVLLITTFSLRTVWWAFIDIFFAFMATFTNAMAVTLKKINPFVTSTLYKCVFVFTILWIIAFIIEWILLN